MQSPAGFPTTWSVQVLNSLLKKNYLTPNEEGTYSAALQTVFKLIFIQPVLVVDVRAWIQGRRRNEKLDWEEVLAKAPLLKKKEIPQDSLVGVVHNMGHWGDELPAVNLNLYAVILFMSNPLGAR